MCIMFIYHQYTVKYAYNNDKNIYIINCVIYLSYFIYFYFYFIFIFFCVKCFLLTFNFFFIIKNKLLSLNLHLTFVLNQIYNICFNIDHN